MVHWVQAITFLTLLATGFAISIASLESLIGHRALLREIHLISAFFFVFGPAVVALAGDRLSIRSDIRSVDFWSRDDVRWLAHPTTRPDEHGPPPGRFNSGQKLNAIFTAYCTLAFGATGLIIWQNRRFPFELVSQANIIHTYLAYLALIVFLGHLYLSVVHPATRPALAGIFTGTVKATWAREHHPGWKLPSSPEAPLSFATAARAFTLLILGLEACLLLTRFAFEWLGANVTDPVTKLIYRFSGLPGTLPHPATGVRSFDLGALVWLGVALAIWYGVRRRRALLPHISPAGQGSRRTG